MRKKTIIIAEAGVNHNGNLETALKLVDAAAFAGVDYVKFQTFKADNLVSKNAQKAEYQKSNTASDETQFEMLKKLELSVEDHYKLYDYCALKGVHFFSTGFDIESLEFLYHLGLRTFKVPSGEITNLPYLRKVSLLADKVIISTGMSTMNDIKLALDVFLDNGISKKDIIVLHCNTEYPTPFADVNLNAMKTIANTFDVEVGYSDHTLGIEVPIAAVSMGATVIEKHFTLSREFEGPDHSASLEPDELFRMVTSIRNIEIALGDGIKKPSRSELKNLAIARKSIHAFRNIKKGAQILENDLIMLRPGDGISPMNLDLIVGKIASQEIREGEKFQISFIKNE